ncbi:MAG: hypothetical protein K2N51_00170 [Lachnospiraceae bacterium]|nr:hypothetical protein [Lachnospiraceae bacterium]
MKALDEKNDTSYDRLDKAFYYTMKAVYNKLQGFFNHEFWNKQQIILESNSFSKSLYSYNNTEQLGHAP